MHVCVEQELFQVNWENGRELDIVDYYFFCFWYASSTLPKLQKCTDISGFHLQWSGNSDVCLISASIWLERGNDFCLWNAALKFCSRPCLKVTCERVMAYTCLPAEAHWLWGHPTVSSPVCLKQWFHFALGSEDSCWSPAGIAASANPSHEGALLYSCAGWSRRLVASSVWHGATLRLCIFWVHRQDRKNPGHGASKAIMFGRVRVLADAHQKRSNLTIGISFAKAPFKPLNPRPPYVPIMEHPSGVQQRFTSTSVLEILFLV